MTNLDVLAHLKQLRKKWRRTGTASARAFEACRFADNRYQCKGEELAYHQCAAELDFLIETIAEAEGLDTEGNRS